MMIRDGKAPFASVTLAIFLEARDLPWMWAIGHVRGRRDTLLIRGTLRRRPELEIEMLDAASWSGREVLPRVPPGWLTSELERPRGMVVHYANAAALKQADTMIKATQRAGLAVKRLSVRGTEPHFQLHLPIPDQQQASHDFFKAVCAIAEHALV
jgi:hypothetical protein